MARSGFFVCCPAVLEKSKENLNRVQKIFMYRRVGKNRRVEENRRRVINIQMTAYK